jgi:VIT1/CCC1 family predicted Fe2+/Mn2+ transporter
MADGLKNSALPRALSEVIADVADLIQKEMRLVRTELSEKLSLKIQGGIWMGAAALLGIIAVLVLIEAAVFGLAAATGLALHWSCLIVAGVLAIAAAAAFAKGRSDSQEELVPERSLHQVKEDIAAVKEQFS